MGANGTKIDKEKYMKEFSLTESDYKKLVKSFKKTAKKGKINEAEFVACFDGIIDEATAVNVFRAFDSDHSGSLDADEYLMMMGVTNFGTTEQKLKASFTLFDRNGDEVLSKEEVKEMLISVVKQRITLQHLNSTGKHISVDSVILDAKDVETIVKIVEEVFFKVDADRSGSIDYQEFVKGFSEHPDVCNFFKQF